jgi:hypothetical protein
VFVRQLFAEKEKNPNKQADRREREKKVKGDVTHEVWVYKTHTAVVA